MAKLEKSPVPVNCQYFGDHVHERLETNQLPSYFPVNHKKLQSVIEQQQMIGEYQPSNVFTPLNAFNNLTARS